MPQYIDADALIKLMNEKHKHLVDENGWYDHYTSGYEDAITDVEEAPIVDAVPVIRCRDCKHWQTDWACNGGKNKAYYCVMLDLVSSSGFYCFHGKRRENNATD